MYVKIKNCDLVDINNHCICICMNRPNLFFPNKQMIEHPFITAIIWTSLIMDRDVLWSFDTDSKMGQEMRPF